VEIKKPPGLSPEAFNGAAKPLDFTDVLGFQTLLALGDFKLHPVTFVEGLKSIRLNRGEVDEYVLASILGNETKTLLVLKPLDGTLCHAATTFLLIKILIIPGLRPQRRLPSYKNFLEMTGKTRIHPGKDPGAAGSEPMVKL
jgi:hypothetical protein